MLTVLHLFIDTNILLRFYSFTDDSLVETEKLTALVGAKQVTLYTTQQLVEEYWRNREVKLAESLRELEKSPLNIPMPRFADHYVESGELLKATNQAAVQRKALVARLKEDIHSIKLPADELVIKLLEQGTIIDVTPDILNKARLRRELGNPPGKKDSLGDQINWEALLEAVPAKDDLHLVSRDNDYASPLDKERVARFLIDEWKRNKDSDVILYGSLGGFTRVHFPHIKLPSDAVKLSALQGLISAGTFSTTHNQIGKLMPIIDEITADEAMMVLQASVDNSQISWIISDDDVKEFLRKLYKLHIFEVPDDLDEELDPMITSFGP